ncbi:hypothetical protein M422DRAFT_154794 [Sphaerobolus stellatus SS14]|nr:hypothetical protein M422DRAFT_154794 [Sphaerobolus stellatus SS14]
MQAETPVVIVHSSQRKQNIACDACRRVDVKCVMPSGHEKCQHCMTKNTACTFNVQRETSEKKRQGGTRRRNSEMTYSSSLSPYYSAFQGQGRSELTPQIDTSAPAGPPYIAPAMSATPPAYPETPTSRLLAYLLSPGPTSTYPEFTSGYRALPDYQQQHLHDDWGEVGLKLRNPAFRREFALDLVEVYFEIYHTRIALIGPLRFRAQLEASLPPVPQAGSTSASSPSSMHQKQDTVHPAIFSAVLAWGAKFSEHPLILMDRNADVTGAQRSRLAKSLIRKAWEIAEAEKVHKVPSVDAVVACLLLDGLHTRYRAFWLNCAVRHLLHLRVNDRSVLHQSLEPDRRNTLIYAWWIACLADSFSSAYFRWKPTLEDNDYNIDFYPHDITRIAQSDAEGVASDSKPLVSNWYAASHAMARSAREMSRQLWRPIIQIEGIPYSVLCSIMRDFDAWRLEYLSKVGVPGPNTGNWDFLAAVAACACGQDATYHSMWIILYQTLREVGIREANELKQPGNAMGSHPLSEFAAIEDKVQKEALNAASRIAGLADLLTQSSYLRLDPNVMHYSIYCAGRLLAEFGREEVAMCVRGLQQYGIAYEDAFEQADEVQRLYAASTARIEQVAQGPLWNNVPANGAANHHPVSDLRTSPFHPY